MNIKAGVASLVVIIGFIDNLIPVEATHYNVSSMVGAEDIYFRLKRRQPSLRHPREEKHRLKENICAEILASDIFNEHKIEVANPNHKTIHDQVKENHPKFYEKYYKTRHSSELGRTKFNNPYRMVDVAVHGQVIREYMFACLARNCSTKNLERYFVSPEYQANGSTAKVRFVFTYNQKKDVVVIAMAESISGATATPSHVTGQSTTQKPTEAPEKSYDEDEDEDDDDYDEEDEEDDESDSESW